MRRVTLCILIAFVVPTPVPAQKEPVFAGIWSSKDPGGVGGLFYDMSWDGLVTRWKELGAGNQYLADVEVYELNGQRRYAALWRVGPGNGALYMHRQDEFLKFWKDVRETQELIDLEVVETTNGHSFLGVWRKKQGRQRANEAFWVNLTWDQLVAKRSELGDAQYLVDVETYGSGDKRRFAGVWRVGSGNGALYWKKDWAEFAELKQSLNKNQEMLDFEMFQAKDGGWNFLGVWRVSDRAGPLHASASNAKFNPFTATQLVEHWEKLQKTATLIGLSVAVPVPPALTALRGDTTCKYGDADCNRCAPDVPAQFKLAFETGHRPMIGWDNGSWSFHGSRAYSPDNLKPEYAFYPHDKPEPAGAGPTSKHIQGFVRTNSSRFPYAGSHSHQRTGSIFFIEREGGDALLHSLYRSGTDHPSGVAVLGDGLFVAEGGFLRRFSVSAAGNKQNHGFKMSAEEVEPGLGSGGGGLGLAKLHDGTTLLIVSAPGNGFRPGTLKAAREDNARPRFTRLYRFVPDVFASGAKPSFLGQWKHEGVSSRPESSRAYSENLSVVTECETGRLYTIHTTGEFGLRGHGYWRLSRVEGDPDRPRLVHVQTARQSQRSEECHLRSSATVHVGKDGLLEFLCSERNIIKFNPTGRFGFKQGTR